MSATDTHLTAPYRLHRSEWCAICLSALWMGRENSALHGGRRRL